VRPSALTTSSAALLAFAAGCGNDYTTPSLSYDFSPIYSTTTPALNDTVTMAAAGFRFLPDAAVSTGGRPAVVLGLSADGGTIAFVPVPGTATGNVTVSGVVRLSQTGVPLTLSARAGITPPAGTTGAAGFSTAPSIGVPASGSSTYFLDAGRFSRVAECMADLVGPCRLYKLTVAAPQRLGLTVSWQGNANLDVYTYNAARAITGLLRCDARRDGPGGQPEHCSATFAPGTYYLAVVSFAALFGGPSGDPTDIQLVLTGLPDPRRIRLRARSTVISAGWRGRSHAGRNPYFPEMMAAREAVTGTGTP
jgi:hypothetical protein